jgi:hypothetical protein
LEPIKQTDTVVIARELSNESLNLGQELAPPPISESPLSDGDGSSLDMTVDFAVTRLAIHTLYEASSQTSQARILCVDYNAINLRILKTFMEKLNFRDVVFAENGSIAFDAVRYDNQRLTSSLWVSNFF